MKKIFLFVLIFISYNILNSQTWRQYNLQTGQITEIPFTYTSTSNSDFTQGNRGILPDNFSGDTSRAFFPLDIINNANAYPWRTTVKFNDVTGVLIDPYHVLTAGHAIEFNPYFQNIKIIPGYENGTEPYNYAYPEYFYLLSNYSPGTSKDYAIIKLDRPLGALAGWNGYGYNIDDAFFHNNIFYSTCYPSQTPYSGDYMYNWKGYFNSVGPEFLLSTRIGSGGMSGGPAFSTSNGVNTVYGIVTNLGIKYNRITSQKFDAINKVINYNTPTQFDLIPMKVNVSPQLMKTGNPFESISFILHNYSTENKTNANISVSVYLSADQVINTSDELITTFNYQKNYSAKSSEIIIQTSNLPILNKSVGDYWVGIIISGDNYTSNNSTNGNDVAPVTITNNNYVTIKGRIVSSQTNSGVNGVTINGFLYPAKTDFDGYYETQITSGWSGTVTPTKEGYNFNNISTTYSNVTQTITTNYTATKIIYSISGIIKSPIAQVPIGNVKLAGLVSEPFTNENGYYSVNVFYGWSGSINPIKENVWDFEPYHYSYSNVTSNVNNFFTAGFHISGRCFENSGMPISGVEIQGFPNNVSTDENGDYRVFLDSGWSGTIVPVKANKIFIPEERSYINIINTTDIQDYMEVRAITLNLKVLLAGAVHNNSDTMSTVLNYKNYLPLTPPDTLSGNGEPFIYFRVQNEVVTQDFFQNHRNIVDWIIIEIRDSKTGTTPIDTIAAFLRRDGKILSLTGDSIITLNINIPPDNYYIIIRHRNHLSVMTSLPIYLSSSSYFYDFSEGIEQF
ncbi:MAG: trypsin-like serine protease, partial [Ignavibacteriae bacterium]|nr:trypsin-like serine protease [Ignavibacteriota bacterium]